MADEIAELGDSEHRQSFYGFVTVARYLNRSESDFI
jgi:hypothetical protein